MALQDVLNAGISKDPNTLLGNVSPLWLAGGPLGLYAGLAAGSYKMAGREQKKGEQIVDNQISDLGSWYKQQAGQSYLDTESVQSALGQLRSNLAETFRAQGNQLAASGGTAEAALAGRTRASQGYGEAVNKLVGYSTDRKDQLSRDYQYRLQNWLQAKLGLQNQKAQNWSNVGSQLVSAPFQVADSLMQNAEGLASAAKFIL